MRIVQTVLTEREHALLEAYVRARGTTIKQAVREAIRKFIVRDEIDPADPVFKMFPLATAKGKLKNLSEEHDRHLYGDGRWSSSNGIISAGGVTTSWTSTPRGASRTRPGPRAPPRSSPRPAGRPPAGSRAAPRPHGSACSPPRPGSPLGSGRGPGTHGPRGPGTRAS